MNLKGGIKMSERRKKAVEEQQSKSHYGDRESSIKEGIFPIYQVKKGDNYIHFLPPEKDDEYFGLRVFVHYRIGVNKGNVLCNAKMFGTPCIMCEEREEMYKRGGAGKEELRALSPSPRYLYIILDVSNRDGLKKGPQIFLAPVTIEDNVRKQSKDPRSGEILDISDPDPKEGRVFYFERTGSTMEDTDYLGFRLYPMDYDIPKSMLKDLPRLSDLLIKRTYEGVADLFRGGIVVVKIEPEEIDNSDRESERQPDLREDRFKERDRELDKEGKKENPVERLGFKEEGEGKEIREERTSDLRHRLRDRKRD